MGGALSQPETEALAGRLVDALSAAGPPSVTVSVTFNGRLNNSAPASAVESLVIEADDAPAVDAPVLAITPASSDDAAVDDIVPETPEPLATDAPTPTIAEMTGCVEADDAKGAAGPIPANQLVLGHKFNSMKEFKLCLAMEELESKRTLRRQPAPPYYHVVCKDCSTFAITLNSQNVVTVCEKRHAQTCKSAPRTIQLFLLTELLRSGDYDLTRPTSEIRGQLVDKYGDRTPKVSQRIEKGVKEAIRLRNKGAANNDDNDEYDEDDDAAASEHILSEQIRGGSCQACGTATKTCCSCDRNHMCMACYSKHIFSVAASCDSRSKRRAF